jgi:hypothetical protein
MYRRKMDHKTMDTPPRLEHAPPGMEFDPLNFEKALVYHLVYHNSVGIQINHLLLLPAYLLGLLLFCSALSPYLLLAVTSLFSLHGLKLSVSFGLFFSAVILFPVSYLALLLRLSLNASPLLSELSSSPSPHVALLTGDANAEPSLVVGFGILFSSLLLQVAGHHVLEDLQPTPNLAHGLLLAPFLEYTLVAMKLLRRIGVYDKPPRIFEEAENVRARLKSQQYMKPGSTSL